MNTSISIVGDDKSVTAAEFIRLFQSLQPQESLDEQRVTQMLAQSINITARFGSQLVGLIRILTDGYLFGSIAEILMTAELFQDVPFLQKMLTVAGDTCPTRLILATHKIHDASLMEEIGWELGASGFVYRRKPRVAVFSSR
jgi:hypothetical protein